MRAIFCVLAALSFPLLAGGCEGFDLGLTLGSDSMEHYEATEAWDGQSSNTPRRKTIAPY